jgi:hypothetical protein
MDRQRGFVKIVLENDMFQDIEAPRSLHRLGWEMRSLVQVKNDMRSPNQKKMKQ